jgi:ABC-2 type transport system ATP-binding protein
MTAVIETSGLTKRYRWVTALSDCTISVPEGRISAHVGPNGAGKTTPLRLLTGLAAPTAGQAVVLGARRARSRPTWRRSASWPRRSRCTGG